MNSISLYLYVNAFLYFTFCIWCLIKFEGSSRFLGYLFLNSSGKVEYLTLYTGMQAGFAVFLAITGYYDHMKAAGLIFCVAIYAGIVFIRVTSALYFMKLEKATYLVGALESSLLIWGVILSLT